MSAEKKELARLAANKNGTGIMVIGSWREPLPKGTGSRTPRR
jgi:hypothetical protein